MAKKFFPKFLCLPVRCIDVSEECPMDEVTFAWKHIEKLKFYFFYKLNVITHLKRLIYYQEVFS